MNQLNQPIEVKKLVNNERIISIDKSIGFLVKGTVKGSTLKPGLGKVYAIEFDKKIKENNKDVEKNYKIKDGCGNYLKLKNLRKIISENFDFYDFEQKVKNGLKNLTISFEEDTKITTNKISKLKKNETTLIKTEKKEKNLKMKKLETSNLSNYNSKNINSPRITNNKNVENNNLNESKVINNSNWDTKGNNNNNFNKEIIELKEENKKLKSKIKIHEDKIKSLQEINLKNKKNSQAKTNIKDNSSDKTKFLEDKIKKIEEKNNILNYMNKEYEQQVENLEKIEKENENLINKINNYNNEIEKLNYNLETIETKNKELSFKNEQILKEKIELNKEKNELNIEKNEIHNEKIKLEKEKNELISFNSSLNTKVEELELDKELMELNLQITSENTDVPDNYEDLVKEYKNIQSIYLSQEMNHKNQIEIFEEKINNLTKQINEDQNERKIINLEEIEKETKNKVDEIDNLKNKIKELEENENFLKKASENLIKKDEIIAKLKEEILEKESLIKESEEMANLYEEIKEELMNEISLLNNDVLTHQDFIKKRDDTLEEKNKVILNLKENIEESNLIIDSLKDQILNKNENNNDKFNTLLGLNKLYDRNQISNKKINYTRYYFINKIKIDVISNYFNTFYEEYKVENQGWDLFNKIIDLKEIEILNKNLIEIILTNYILIDNSKDTNFNYVNELLVELSELDRFYYIINKKILNFGNFTNFEEFESYIIEIVKLKEWYEFMIDTTKNNMISANNSFEKLLFVKELINKNKNEIFDESELNTSLIIKNISVSLLKLTKIISKSKFSKNQLPERYYNLLEELKDLFNDWLLINVDDSIFDITENMLKIENLDEFFIIKDLKEKLNSFKSFDYIKIDNIWNLKLEEIKIDINNNKSLKLEKDNMERNYKEISEKNITFLKEIEKIKTININLEKKISDNKEELKNIDKLNFENRTLKNKINFLEKKKRDFEEIQRKSNNEVGLGIGNSQRNVELKKKKLSIVGDSIKKKEIINIGVEKNKGFSTYDKKLLSIYDIIYKNMKYNYANKSINNINNNFNKIVNKDMPYFSSLLNKEKNWMDEIQKNSKEFVNDLSVSKNKIISKLINIKAIDLSKKESKKEFLNDKKEISKYLLNINNYCINNDNLIINIINENKLNQISNDYEVIGNIKKKEVNFEKNNNKNNLLI